MSKLLQNVRKGPTENPFKIVLYGLEGVGKSSFAAEAPRPIFMDLDSGTDELDVERLPEIGDFQGVLAALDELANDQHDYRTFVLDTADSLEPVIWRHVCTEGNVKNIEDIGYGKGYAAALDHWRSFLARLDVLRSKRGMNVVILAHSHIRGFRNPAGDDFERYELKLNAKAASLIKEWPSAILFARYQTYTHKDKDGRIRGVGDGSRVVSTEPRPAWDAKNRYNLPSEMPLSWREFETAARAGVSEDPATLGEQIEKLIEVADEKVRVEAKAAITRAAGDPRKLAKLADWLRGKVQKAA